jgi:hypothetical protein
MVSEWSEMYIPVSIFCVVVLREGGKDEQCRGMHLLA